MYSRKQQGFIRQRVIQSKKYGTVFPRWAESAFVMAEGRTP